MHAALFKPLSRISLALAVGAGLVACVSVSPSEAPSLTKASPVAPTVARDAAIVGKTKSDVLAMLGQTVSVKFDSGYEVWVYHLSEGPRPRARGKAEYVVLFDPSGVVTKARVRPHPLGERPRG